MPRDIHTREEVKAEIRNWHYWRHPKIDITHGSTARAGRSKWRNMFSSVHSRQQIYWYHSISDHPSILHACSVTLNIALLSLRMLSRYQTNKWRHRRMSQLMGGEFSLSSLLCHTCHVMSSWHSWRRRQSLVSRWRSGQCDIQSLLTRSVSNPGFIARWPPELSVQSPLIQSAH